MTIQKTVTLAAATAIDNLLAGSIYEWMQSDAILNLGFVADDVGLVISFFINGEMIAEDLIPTVDTTARAPRTNEDYPITDEPILGGSKLTVKVRNTTAATSIDITYAVNITPA